MKKRRGTFFSYSIFPIILISFIILLVLFQIIARQIMKHPPIWVLDAVLWSWLFFALWGFFLVEKRDSHMGISLIFDSLGVRHRIIIQIIWLLIYIPLLIFLSYLAFFKTVIRLWLDIDKVLHISSGLLYIPVGVAFTSILILNLFRLFKLIAILRTRD